MSRKKKKRKKERKKMEPLYRQLWFWAMLTFIIGTLFFQGYQSGFFANIARFILGPSSAQQAEERALYDQAMEDLEKALETGDISILEERWCGEARVWAERMVREGGKERLDVLGIEYGLGFPAAMSINEVWTEGATEMSYVNNVWLDMERGCITTYHATMLEPEGEMIIRE